MRTIIWVAWLAFQGLAQTVGAQEGGALTLTIEVRDVEKARGQLYVAFYSSGENFLKKPLTGLRVEVDGGAVAVPCRGLLAGEYAFSLFLDENGNGRLDTGAFGIPMEKYAFSNDAEGVMGPPSYEKCRFTLSADTTLVVHLR